MHVGKAGLDKDKGCKTPTNAEDNQQTGVMVCVRAFHILFVVCRNFVFVERSHVVLP
jgi:hypothetical protein